MGPIAGTGTLHETRPPETARPVLEPQIYAEGNRCVILFTHHLRACSESRVLWHFQREQSSLYDAVYKRWLT